MVEKSYEKHAWVLLVIAASPVLFFAVVHIISDGPRAFELVEGNLGISWEDLASEEPEIANVIRGFVKSMGVFALGFAALFMVIVTTGYRKGERWAWYAALLFPAILIGFAPIVPSYGGWQDPVQFRGVITGIVTMLALMLLGLLLPFRRFFPKAS